MPLPPYCLLQVEQRQTDGRWITGARYVCRDEAHLQERLSEIAQRSDMRPVGVVMNGVLRPLEGLSTGLSTGGRDE